MSYLNRDEILQMGFASVGDKVQLSSKASYYNCAKIQIGSNVRIDDFCVISAGEKGITIGNHVHLAIYSSLIGAGKITISNFCNVSSRVAIYSSSDDYSGHFLTNPTIAEQYTSVKHADVFLDEHVIIGCGSVVLPGVQLGKGVAIGALSLVTRSCDAFGIYAGIPVKRIKDRHRGVLDVADAFCAESKRECRK